MSRWGVPILLSLLGASVVCAEDSQVGKMRPADAELVAAPQSIQPPTVMPVSLSQVNVAGQSAFLRSCTTCHDERRALDKRKTYSQWLATVQRMAAKDGAGFSTLDIGPIAAYLSSVAGSASAATDAAAIDGAGSGGASAELAGGASGWSLAATISLLHRSASDEYPLENPGFFGDLWLTAGYQSSGPWRATVTACTSCHARDNGAGNAFSLELVEGSAALDLRHLFHGCRCDDGPELILKAGRFIVPFGAFSAMSNPGVYRTVTNPLMFNMGRRVLVPGFPPVQPVLPAPFADEGLDLTYRRSMGDAWMFTLDAYAINGLQGTGPNLFNRSRAYFDNNEDPSGGGRMTLGADYFRLGTSILTGNLQDRNVQPRF
jgi:hypothetical protein